MKTVTATDMKNNFGKYLKDTMNGDEIIIMKNGTEVARLVSYNQTVSFLSDSLLGILKNDYSDEEIKGAKTLKYGTND